MPNMTDYDKTYRSFKVDVPERFNFGRDIVDRWAEDDAKLALISVDSSGNDSERLTFLDLKLLSNRFANLLLDLGLRKGDRAFIMAAGSPQWYVAMIGMMKVGLVPMPATTQSTPNDVSYRLNRAQARLAIADSASAEKVDQAATDVESLERILIDGGSRRRWTNWEQEMDRMPTRLGAVETTHAHDPLLIYFTSGTVGPPKMVLHTQASYGVAQVVTARFWQDLKSDDIQWAVSDTGWAKKVSGSMLGQWTLGATVLQFNPGGVFEPVAALGVLETHDVTAFCAPPTAYRMMVQENLVQYDLSSLRSCTASGEPLNPEVMKMWEEGTGLTIYDGYGQTETVPLIANYPCIDVKPGSMGKPMPGIEVAVVDDQGTELRPGEEGQIAVRVKPRRPVGLFEEYWNDQEAMKSVFRGDWYYTGDNAYRDEEGYYWFVGRSDDVIVSAGNRIGPFEVESVLLEHRAVAESAVVAWPDPLSGHIVKAYVVLAPGYEASDELIGALKRHTRGLTAAYKCPKVIEFVPDLPKTISGKIRRVELRERETADIVVLRGE